MIIWIASYPKSGNTWVRAFLSAYYFTEDGRFDPNKLKLIEDYPNKTLFAANHKINYGEIYKFWNLSQKKILKNKKVRFFKTHNALLKVFDREFTSPKYTLGTIYVVRDPRNVITSLKNHYDFPSYEVALKFMLHKENYIWGQNNDYAKSQIISSWKINYVSWVKKNNYNKILIKYEDLIKNPEKTFKQLIIFTNKILKREEIINDERLKNAIKTTNFDSMKKVEKDGLFDEQMRSEKTNELKKFFFLGPENNWKNILDENTIKSINENFIDELKELNYEI